MKRNIIIMGILTLLAGCAGTQENAPTPEETTLTKVGQMAPDFTVQDLEGQSFTLSEQRGKIVLINWFATWCPPCKEEMPHLQKQVWEEFQGEDFVLVSVAREETAEVVAPFVTERDLTWRFLLDPDRTAYARYAGAFIPRNHLIGRDGTIVFQSNGFEKEDFENMISILRKELEPRGH